MKKIISNELPCSMYRSTNSRLNFNKEINERVIKIMMLGSSIPCRQTCF